MGRWANAGATVMLGCCLAAVAVAAQPAPPAERPQLRAAPVTLPPVLDGDVVGDPAWAEAEVAEGFWQTTPDEGRPATERVSFMKLGGCPRSELRRGLQDVGGSLDVLPAPRASR